MSEASLPKRLLTKKRVIVSLLLLLFVSPAIYLTLRRDIYEDPRPEDILELLHIWNENCYMSSPPRWANQVANWFGKAALLEEFCRKRTMDLREAAFIAVGKLLASDSKKEIIPYLTAALNDKEWLIRSEAATLLFEIDPETFPEPPKGRRYQ